MRYTAHFLNEDTICRGAACGGRGRSRGIAKNEVLEGLPAVSKCNEPVGGPSHSPPDRGETGGRNIGPAVPRGAGDAGGDRRQRYAHVGGRSEEPPHRKPRSSACVA
jgi:hypothetical protein